MNSKLILGIEPWLSLAAVYWTEAVPGISCRTHQVSLDAEYKFDFNFLASYPSSEMTGFVAWGNEFINFQRWEIFGELKKRGFKLPPLIHPNAIGADPKSVGENSWISPQTVISPNANIGINSVIGIATIIGSGVTIKNNVWVGDNSSIGYKCEIDSHVIIGNCVNIDPQIKVGKFSIREVPGRIHSDVDNRSFNFLLNDLQGTIIDYGSAGS